MIAAWFDNFMNEQTLNTAIFQTHWGKRDEFLFGNKGLTLKSDGTHAGFLTQDWSAKDANGYGLYKVTFTMPISQPVGAYICLWPASNVWPGPEIDFTELQHGKPYLTVHWKGAGNTNKYHTFFFSADLSEPTTVALDWQANSLTFSVNGKEVVQYLAGGPVPVPKDYADGGQNEAFGIGNDGPKGTLLTVSIMSYSPSS